jgi:hypothetical protein
MGSRRLRLRRDGFVLITFGCGGKVIFILFVVFVQVDGVNDSVIVMEVMRGHGEAGE